MSDEEKMLAKAREVLEDLSKVLDGQNWKHEKDVDALKITFSARGDDLPLHFAVHIQPDPGVIRLYSHLPFEVRKEKLVDVAIGVCAVNYQLTSGMFDLNISNGNILYRISQLYCGDTVNDDIFMYMIYGTGHVVDEYNDMFMALSTGNMDLDSFIAKVQE